MTAIQNLHASIKALYAANDSFRKGEISSITHGQRREAALIDALCAMAESFGVTLERPVSIDSRGDISVVCPQNCPPYGEQFVKWLNESSPRCGTGIAVLLPESRWCRINHFSLELMVIEYSRERSE